jgi:hypothetical protein
LGNYGLPYEIPPSLGGSGDERDIETESLRPSRQERGKYSENLHQDNCSILF